MMMSFNMKECKDKIRSMYIHGQLGVEAARIWGILPNANLCWQIQEEDKGTVKIAMENIGNTLDIWQHQLNQSATNDGNLKSDMNVIWHTMWSEVSAMSDLCNYITNNNLRCDHKTEYVLLTDVESLNDDQQHAYNIVDWHLKETMIGTMPPQLLMMIPGEGGVGRSRLIQTMTENF